MRIKPNTMAGLERLSIMINQSPKSIVDNVLVSYLSIPALDSNDRDIIFALLNKAVDEAERKQFFKKGRHGN